MKKCTKWVGFFMIIGALYFWYKSYFAVEEDEEPYDFYQAPSVEEPGLDINSATAEELQGVRGVGESLAERIVEYRNEHGPFLTVDDLRQVSGVGEHNFNTLRDQLVVG
ncbi:MAG: ComEA family DNA-binding protein [Thermodesulfobacteriota bacterium]